MQDVTLDHWLSTCGSGYLQTAGAVMFDVWKNIFIIHKYAVLFVVAVKFRCLAIYRSSCSLQKYSNN